MTQITCRFDFHPVGQGLFYSGQVNDFRFVYDCGTTNAKRYITDALDGYDVESPLDLLVISHFHADHMNGVKNLLGKTQGVREVVLPYLFPAERLLAGAGYAIANDLDGLDDDYISFLADPVGYLTALGGDDVTISFLQPGEVVTDWPDAGEQAAGEYDWYPNDPLHKEDYPDLAGTSNNVNLRLHRSIYRTPAPLWGFKFYCQPGQVTQEQIKDELAKLNVPIAVADIPKVLRDRLDDIKKVYTRLFKSSRRQNAASVVCCHGPAVPKRGGGHLLHGYANICLQPASSPTASHHWHDLDDYIGHCFFDCHWAPLPPRHRRFLFPPLQLLTGDAELQADQVQTHFMNEVQAIGLALIPHHGADDNWLPEFPTMMPNCILWAVSFGLGNSYHHPNTTVVDAISNAERHVLLCTQAQRIAVHGGGWRSP
jgi:hypothetical protein